MYKNSDFRLPPNWIHVAIQTAWRLCEGETYQTFFHQWTAAYLTLFFFLSVAIYMLKNINNEGLLAT